MTAVLSQGATTGGAKTDKAAQTTEEHPAGAVAKRFSVNLRHKDVERLGFIAKTYDITPTEVLRRALATEDKLIKIVEEGGQVLVNKPDGHMLELDLQYR